MENKPLVRLTWDSKDQELNPNFLLLQEMQKIIVNQVGENKGYYQPMELPQPGSESITNLFYAGDNLDLLNAMAKAEPINKIDLIYIDPPYMTEVDYYSTINIGADQTRKVKRAAFADRWPQGLESYLDMLYRRLMLMHQLLNDTGSIFVHVDWHVSHYVRILLDEIFGADNFINEIVWCFGGGSNARRNFHRKHDLIFWYGCSDQYTFNPQRRPYTHGTINRGLTQVKGDRYQLHPQGAMMQDWWVDINKILSPTAYENLKFPTQKPRQLLKRLVAAASNPGDVVADFFAGSGTIAAVCNEMDRNWILADSSPLALQTTCYRLISSGSPPFKIFGPSGAISGENDGELILKQPVLNPSENYTLVDVGIDYYCPAQLQGQLQAPADQLNWVDYIEFWEIDFNFQDNIFNSQFQVLRNGHRFKEPLSLDILIRLDSDRDYRGAVKVWDIWGNQALKTFTVTT